MLSLGDYRQGYIPLLGVSDMVCTVLLLRSDSLHSAAVILFTGVLGFPVNVSESASLLRFLDQQFRLTLVNPSPRPFSGGYYNYAASPKILNASCYSIIDSSLTVCNGVSARSQLVGSTPPTTHFSLSVEKIAFF